MLFRMLKPRAKREVKGQTVLTIKPNDYIKVGDILTVGGLYDKPRNYLVTGVDGHSVLVVNPNLWQRLKLWAQDLWLEVKILWWSKRWFK